MKNQYLKILEYFLRSIKKKEREREVVCGQVWWPILGICPLHLTHPSARSQQWTHTWSSGQPYFGARGAVGGSVPCSRVSPQSWYWRWREHLLFTPPTDNPCRTWESNRQPLGYKSNSLTIRPRLPKDLQKGFAKQKSSSSLKYVHLCTQYLVGAPLAQNSSISEVWHGSDEPVALLRHYWAFSSSGLLDRLFLIFFLKISHRFHAGFRSGMLAGQSSTVISWSAKHLEVVLAVWAGAKVLLEKGISISIKLVSRWKHNVL